MRRRGPPRACGVSAGIGAFAVGLVVLINEAGIVAVPRREIDATRIDVWTLILTGLGMLATFPPIWK